MMDYEYEDDVDEYTLDYFEDLIRRFPVSDEDVREVFRTLIAAKKPILLHDMFAFEFKESDIRDCRVTQICKSTSNFLFRIQFLNGNTFVLRLSNERSYEDEIAIINAVAGVGVEVPRSYFSHPDGVNVGGNYYYAMLQEFKPGKSFEYLAHNGLITISDKEIVLEEMGKRLRKIHSIKNTLGQDPISEIPDFYSEALDLLDHEREKIIGDGICERSDFEEVFLKADSLRNVAGLFGKEALGLAHMDYHPKNVILDISSGTPKLTAILHWGQAEFTNTFFDFALWDYWCGEDFLVDSLLESYGMEVFSSAESKVNVEITTITSLINVLCRYAEMAELKASQLGVWQRLKHEIEQATY